MVRIEFSRRRLTITGVGLAAVVMVLAMIIALFALPRLFSDPFTPAQAQNALRHFLQSQIYQSGMDELKFHRAKAPDLVTAQRWQEQIERVKRLEIVSLEIKRPLLHLFSIRPSYVLKVVLKDAERRHSPRYFSTVRDLVTSESGEWLWWLAY